MGLLLSFKDIKKRFNKTTVLAGINLAIKEGEIFGLLGVNGAGKTTLIRCLLKSLKINGGSIFFKGAPLKSEDIHKNIGFLPENFLPPQNLKAVEFLKILSWGLDSKPDIANILLEKVGLKDQENKYIKTYSRGMIQRLGLAGALLKDPQLIVLDEPTLGLDPLGQQYVLDLLADLNKKGKTIFFSSHILSQIEKVCTRIGIIHAGKMRYIGRVREIVAKHRAQSLEEAFLKEIKT